MQVIEVISAQEIKVFLEMPLKIYKDDPNWIRPLDNDIESVFSPAKNKFFRHGECIRWIVKNDTGNTVGRVAAFIDKRTAVKNNEQPTGGLGFFECINDKNVAFLLFDTAKNWLQQKGMEAMDGPVNFGERDSWWGLLVEGFSPPVYKMNYNPSYYKQFFEEYGFKVYFKQFCYALKVVNRLQGKFYERHATLAADKNYTCCHIRKKDLAKYAEDFRIIYNKAWVKHGSGKELEKKQTLQFFIKMKTVIDEKLIWYVYYKDEPVACWVNLPDINQIFKKFNGKFGLIEKLRFLWLFRMLKMNRMVGLVFGVIPEHQGKGVDSYMIVEGANLLIKDGQYKYFEMQWIGDFNPKMITVAEGLGTWKSRTLITYRKLFDSEKEFHRHPMIN